MRKDLGINKNKFKRLPKNNKQNIKKRRSSKDQRMEYLAFKILNKLTYLFSWLKMEKFLIINSII
jgi:hypothetical protein